MTALYVLAAEHRELALKLMDLDLDEQTIADTLEAESGELTVKAQNIAVAIRNLEEFAAAIKADEQRQAERRKAVETRAESLKRALFGAMQFAGIKKIEGPQFTLAIQGAKKSVDVFQPELIPEAFMRYPLPPPAAPDKAAIYTALTSGVDVPGARLVGGERLAIK